MMKKLKYGTIFVSILVIIGFIYNSQFASGFNISLLDPDRIYEHIVVLSSDEFEGRLPGSEGNQKSLEYINKQFEEIGLEPGSIDGSYYQGFNTVMPIIDENPIFSIYDDTGELTNNYVMYKDYNIMTAYEGGGIDFNGEIIIVGSNLLRVPKEELKNKIILTESKSLDPKRIKYVSDNGGLGLFCSTNVTYMGDPQTQKIIYVDDKTGKTILAGYMSNDVYENLLSQSTTQSDDNKYIKGRVKHAVIKISVDFPIISTANIIGKIQGSDKNGRVLILSASVGGIGSGTNGDYFPSAIASSSGIATLIEVARVLKEQQVDSPDTIVFVGWNAELQQFAGSKHYLENPIYPLDKTTLIHTYDVGVDSLEGLKVSSDLINSSILRDKFMSYGRDNNTKLSIEDQRYSTINGFIDELVPSLMLRDGNKWRYTYDDHINNISLEALENSAIGLLSFIQRDSYKDFKIDYLNKVEKLMLLILAIVIVINSSVNYVYNKHPNKKIMSITIESVYYSIPARLIRAFMKTVFPYFVIVMIIIILANISPQTNIKNINGQWMTNFSPYIIIKKSIYYLRNLVNPEVHLSYAVGNIYDMIIESSKKSLTLIVSALVLSVIFGISKGLIDGMRATKNKISSLGTLIVFSIPDVLIVLLGLLFYVYVAVNYPQLSAKLNLREFLLPLITLMIIPTIYISRITFITTQTELDKDYIKHAKAIGMSKIKVFMTELFPAVVFTIVDTLPGIMAMLFTNMIIVEYLFNYNGISYYLLYLYNRNDTYRFVPLALTLGAIYVLFTYGISWIAKLINPLKREVKSK